MMRSTPSPASDADMFLDQLAADLTPVRPLDDRPTQFVLALLVLGATLMVVQFLGMRADVAAGLPQPMFLLRGGTLLLLGTISALALLAHAHPGVGRTDQGWRTAVLLAGLFPLAGALVALRSPAQATVQATSPDGMQCLAVSLAAALVFAVPMVLHLRRGAPVAPERAGLLVGLAAGSLGAFAYGLHCPFDSPVYIGLWYGLAVGAATLAGRLLVPPLIRW